MGLFNRSAGAEVTVAPAVVRPRQTVTATVTTDKPVDKVTAATLEWGYTNFYRYRWAGRADSTAVEMNNAWWMLGEVGTDAGSEKDTEDWVGVTKVDLPSPQANSPVLLLRSPSHHGRLDPRTLWLDGLLG